MVDHRQAENDEITQYAEGTPRFVTESICSDGNGFDNIARRSKILVVEDDQDVNDLVCRALAREGNSVDSASDGNDAAFLLDSVLYDLVILDWQLPGLTGPEVLERFSAGRGRCSVIMLTGKSSISDKELGYGLGVDDYVTKPFNIRELLLRARSLLRRPRCRGMMSSSTTV